MSMTLSPPLAADAQIIEDRHWTVEEFYRAYDMGKFGYSKRWELIQGRIIKKMPPRPRHASLADMIAEMLREAMQPAYIVREEKPVHLAFDTEPVPDITVAHGARKDYRERHPTAADTVLVVEVADTSVAKDLGEKAKSYAEAGMTDYWVVLVNEDALVVHREPTPAGYKEVTRLTESDAISPLAMPNAVWTINALLGREEAS